MGKRSTKRIGGIVAHGSGETGGGALPASRLPEAERLALLDRFPVFDYPAAARVRETIVEVVRRDFAGAGWPPMLLVGPSDNGRTTVMRGVGEALGTWGRGGGMATMTMPIAADAEEAHGRFLSAMSSTLAPAGLVDDGSGADLKLVVVDGCDALATLPADTRGLLLACLRTVTEAGVAVVAVGTGALAATLLADVDRHGAVERLLLPRWELDADWTTLLDTVELALPLREPSHLSRRETARHLHALCDGRLGSLTRIVRGAAAAAIQTGAERITGELLDDLGLQARPGFAWTFG